MLFQDASSLTPETTESRPVRVINRAIESGRLGHALLLFADDLGVLNTLATDISKRLLNTPRPDALQHPDLVTLSPVGRAQMIRIGESHKVPNTVRALVRRIQLTPSESQHKVAILYEVDRMNAAAANALLKTLEEPPVDSTLILLTTRPYHLLPTIRSRCMNFRIPAPKAQIDSEEWKSWLADYQSWLKQVIGNVSQAKNHPDALIMPIYGLIYRFSQIIESIIKDQWDKAKKNLPDHFDKEQTEATQASLRKALRRRMWTEIEQITREHILEETYLGQPVYHAALARVIDALERAYGTTELNYPAENALEHFFLSSLRIWTRARHQSAKS